MGLDRPTSTRPHGRPRGAGTKDRGTALAKITKHPSRPHSWSFWGTQGRIVQYRGQARWVACPFDAKLKRVGSGAGATYRALELGLISTLAYTTRFEALGWDWIDQRLRESGVRGRREAPRSEQASAHRTEPGAEPGRAPRPNVESDRAENQSEPGEPNRAERPDRTWSPTEPRTEPSPESRIRPCAQPNSLQNRRPPTRATTRRAACRSCHGALAYPPRDAGAAPPPRAPGPAARSPRPHDARAPGRHTGPSPRPPAGVHRGPARKRSRRTT